jgi:putative DNA primase/helicase
MTHRATVAASADPVPHPRWDALLDLFMGGDPAKIHYLRQMLGLLLTGDVSEKCFWFWVGKTDAGKTTLLELLHELLGDFVYKIPLRALLERREGMVIRHDLAGLRGVRLAYAEEFKPGDVLDGGVMKDITGGKTITADRKGEANQTFRVTAKVVLGTNDLPKLKEVDEAIRNRVRCLPFSVNVPATLSERGAQLRKMEELVPELIAAEGPGILQDLVAAVVEWRTSGGRLVLPEDAAKLTKVYLDREDPLVEWIATCCVPDDGTSACREELPFKMWYWSFRTQSGRTEREASQNWFGRQLPKHGYVRRTDVAGARYTGRALTWHAKHEADMAYMSAKQREEKYGNAR